MYQEDMKESACPKLVSFHPETPLGDGSVVFLPPNRPQPALPSKLLTPPPSSPCPTASAYSGAGDDVENAGVEWAGGWGRYLPGKGTSKIWVNFWRVGACPGLQGQL